MKMEMVTTMVLTRMMLVMMTTPRGWSTVHLRRPFISVNKNILDHTIMRPRSTHGFGPERSGIGGEGSPRPGERGGGNINVSAAVGMLCFSSECPSA